MLDMKLYSGDNVRVDVEKARLPRVIRGESFIMTIDGNPVTAYEGETIAAVMVASGIRTFHHADDGSHRGLYCGIGRCFSCLVTVDSQSGVRACVTKALPGMQVTTTGRGNK